MFSPESNGRRGMGLVARAAIACCLGLQLSMTAEAATILVPSERATIQRAIDSAEDGDDILVSPGEYAVTTSVDFRGKAVRVHSEGGAAATVIRFEGALDRGSVVVFDEGETAESELDGFTITGGIGTLAGARNGGGILCVDGSSPTLENLIVLENRAGYGGALYCQNSAPTVLRCIFARNVVTCGGGAYLDGSAPVFEDCVIRENRGSYASSGIHSKNDSKPRLERCLLLGNTTHYGGAVDSFGSHPVLVNCVLAGNLASQGGAVYVSGGSLELHFSTIASNSTTQGYSIESLSGRVQLAHCIYQDSPMRVDPTLELSNSLVGQDPGFVNPGTFDFTMLRHFRVNGESVSTPDFVVEEPDYHLMAGSVAIDRLPGSSWVSVDLDGLPRPQGAGFDLGAYEYPAARVSFLRGDGNRDGIADLSDAVTILGYLFEGLGSIAGCPDAADANDDGRVDLSDPIAILSYLFIGAEALPEPFAACGTDATADVLHCSDPQACKDG